MHKRYTDFHSPCWCAVVLALNVCFFSGNREYDIEAASRSTALSFGAWLRRRCAVLSALEQEEQPEVMALSLPPSRKACAFTSMSSYGSHYRVDMEEGTQRHVTYDSGIAELKHRIHGQSSSAAAAQVELARVGVLKNILVLNYGNVNMVFMVVSWVPKNTDERQTLRRDAHGFWLANMHARPRDTTNPYLLPALASQAIFFNPNQLFPRGLLSCMCP